MYNQGMKRKIRKQSNISGKKECDICRAVDFLQAHHINGRDVPKYNQDWNVANLCASCHYNVHMGAINISGWFDTTNGRELIYNNVNEVPIVDSVTNIHVIKKYDDNPSKTG